MHKDMIKKLYYGEIIPSNSISYKTKKYVEASNKFYKLKELLKSSLDNKQSEFLDDIIEAKEAMTDEIIFGSFKEGFKIGMCLTAEGLKSNSKQDKT